MLVGQLDVSEQFSGKRKQEIGLVVPAKFKALTKEYRLAKTLDEQLQARKENYTHFEIVHVEKSFKKISNYVLKIAFKVLAYRFVFFSLIHLLRMCCAYSRAALIKLSYF